MPEMQSRPRRRTVGRQMEQAGWRPFVPRHEPVRVRHAHPPLEVALPVLVYALACTAIAVVLIVLFDVGLPW